MTFSEILAVAAKHGTLRWTKSGTVEHLRINKKGLLLARPVKQSKEHPLRPPTDLATAYDCIEVDSVTKKPIGGADGMQA